MADLRLLAFAAVSALYVAALAVVDGLFNRLVFRENRRAPYGSSDKQALYRLPEWRWIGLLYLILIPVAIPALAAWAIGGRRYLLAHLAALFLVQWDLIFGKLVFDDWWGDTPSIALPALGWIQFPLRWVVAVRLIVGATFLGLALGG